MKFSYAALVAFVPAILAASVPDKLAKREGGAFQTCTGPIFQKIGNGIVIQMRCGDGRGGYKNPLLNLSDCIGNQSGRLVVSIEMSQMAKKVRYPCTQV
ncbi:hypothetical protein ABW21_db0202585 [Orbilia brochopaga]|nr:hypothetical protein ABW21_db0202585 [Drechslerella brochopaga]